jgi:hypothetical protein
MATFNEQRSQQADHYFELLDLQARNPGIKIIELKAKIQRAKAVMTEPEIAWVEKQIAELYSQE